MKIEKYQTMILVRRKDSFCLFSLHLTISAIALKDSIVNIPNCWIFSRKFRSFVFFSTAVSHTPFLIWASWCQPDKSRFYSEHLILTWWLRELKLSEINWSARWITELVIGGSRSQAKPGFMNPIWNLFLLSNISVSVLGANAVQ